jgi:hypothetical protein
VPQAHRANSQSRTCVYRAPFSVPTPFSGVHRWQVNPRGIVDPMQDRWMCSGLANRVHILRHAKVWQGCRRTLLCNGIGDAGRWFGNAVGRICELACIVRQSSHPHPSLYRFSKTTNTPLYSPVGAWMSIAHSYSDRAVTCLGSRSCPHPTIVYADTSRDDLLAVVFLLLWRIVQRLRIFL